MKIENKEIVLQFNLDGFSILEDDEDISVVKLRLYHLGVNRNKCDISKECSDLSMSNFYEKPIVYRLNNKYFPNGSTDVAEHARDKDSTMIIAGIITKDSTPEYEYDEKNGKTYLVATGILYKAYQPILMQILKHRDGNIKISIEIVVLDGEENKEGILVIKKFKLRGVTLLGEKIPEGIEGSSLEVLKFAEAKDDLNKKYKVFSHCNKSNFEIPEYGKLDIKNTFDKYKRGENGFTKKEITVLNTLSNKDTCSYIEAHVIKSCFYNINNSCDDVKLNTEWIDKIIENEVEAMSLEKENKTNIKIDKTIKSMSDTAWGDIDKTELRNKVMSATNKNSLVKDVYLQVEEGWEEAPSEKLKYPVMEIKGDTAVYNRNGLSSAKGYAETEDDTEVINKLKSIYKKLELDDKKKEDNKPMLDKEKEKENKLDKDNEELEKIRDDAEAKEDEKKEKLKAKAIKKNAIDEKEDEDLEDDVDSDEDEMEKKYACEIEAKNSQIEELQAKCNAYERKDLEEKMNAMVEEYKECFSEEEKEELIKEMKNAKTEEEFSSKVFSCVAKNVKKNKEEKEVVKNSYHYSIPADYGYKFDDKEVDNIKDLAKSYRGGK